jgi:hypothetical protein
MTFFETDRHLQGFGDRLITAITAQFDLSSDRIALTLLIHDRDSIINLAHADPDQQTFWQRKIRGFSHRGVEIAYPAGIVNLFYMVALQEWLETGMIATTPEIDRALTDAIANCSYDASNYIVDILSGTTSGPEISDGPFATWQYQRQIVNRYFHNLGIEAYKPINVCQKLWRNGPYGRERTFHGDTLANRNMLTTDATAHLLYSIMTGIAISKERATVMQNLLQRSLNAELVDHNQSKDSATQTNPVDQVKQIAQPEQTGDRSTSNLDNPDRHHHQHSFLSNVLPENAKLWSMADRSMEVSNHAMHVEIPEHRAFTLVVFCESSDPNADRQVMHHICQQVIAETINKT